MYKIAICDENADCVKYIEKKVSENLNSNAAFLEFTSGDVFATKIGNGFDLVFLDYELNGISTLELAKEIKKNDSDTIVVFLLSGKDLSLAKKLHPYRYLLKSMSNEEIESEMKDILKYLVRKNKVSYLSTRVEDGTKKIIKKDIYEVSKYKGGSLIRYYDSEKGMVLSIKSLDSVRTIFGRLGPKSYAFIGSKHFINLKRIKNLDGRDIMMDDNSKISISLGRKNKFNRIYTEYSNKEFTQM